MSGSKAIMTPPPASRRRGCPPGGSGHGAAATYIGARCNASAEGPAGWEVVSILTCIPEAAQSFQIDSAATSIGGVTLKSWDQPHPSASAIQQQL
jgi:hypothetical protein